MGVLSQLRWDQIVGVRLLGLDLNKLFSGSRTTASCLDLRVTLGLKCRKHRRRFGRVNEIRNSITWTLIKILFKKHQIVLVIVTEELNNHFEDCFYE